ncbi:gas vesicle protein GvpG [Spirillospora sp. CA-255316]
MGLLTGLLTLPLAPVRGVVWVAARIRDQAEQEFYDPVVIRRQLAEVDAALAAGEISEEEAAELQDLLLDRLWAGTSTQTGL